MAGVNLVKSRAIILKIASPKVSLPEVPKNGVSVFCFLLLLKGFYFPNIAWQACEVPAVGHYYRSGHLNRENFAVSEQTNKELLDLVVIVRLN